MKTDDEIRAFLAKCDPRRVRAILADMRRHKKPPYAKAAARRAAFKALVSLGITKSQAARMMGVSQGYGYQKGL